MNPRSETALAGVHADIASVVRLAATYCGVQFIVTEGRRTAARQEALVAAGASKTMNSRHLTGHAVDLAPVIAGQVRWDWPPFYEIAVAMKRAAKELGVALTWGGDWRAFKDGPHFELDWKAYP